MPIDPLSIISGPDIQADGQYHGALSFTFSDGRTVTKSVRAANKVDWDQMLIDLPPQVQVQMERKDADSGVDPTSAISERGEASAEQGAVAYLRAAMKEEQAIDAYLLLDRFNDFRLGKGWSLGQVAVNLQLAGLSFEEWTRVSAAYQYLSGGNNPDTMTLARAVQFQWESR